MHTKDENKPVPSILDRDWDKVTPEEQRGILQALIGRADDLQHLIMR